MLSFFPKLYPDELLYSGLARYHIRSGNKSFAQTDIELLGYHCQQISKVALPSNLGYLVKHLPLGSKLTVDNFIQNHTLYPFYTTFLTPQEAWLVRDSMKKKFNSSIFKIAKVAFTSTGDVTKFLIFCPLCLEEDTQKYGEAYWHRMHQIPGVFVCLIHGIALQNSIVPVETGGIDYYATSPENCLFNPQEITYSDDTLSKLLMFAKDIELLMNSRLSFKGLPWLRSQYTSYLVNKKFMTIFSSTKFIFHERDFSDSIFAFYGQDILNIVQLSLSKNPEKYFSNCLLACDLNSVIDRITHTLMIKFLANSLEDFLK